MKKLLSIVFCIFAVAIAAVAQTARPTPPADDDVVKISTTLIQLDVTVTDSGGRVIRDLKPEDFEVFENGERQKITNFSFVSRTKTAAPVTTKTVDPVGVPIPPTALRNEQVRRTIALVVDDLSLSFESAHFVRRALKKFVDEQMADGDLVAIIRTGAGIGALQQFTSDKRQLYAAIEKVLWNPAGRGNIGAFATINDGATISNEDASEEDIQAQENFENAFEDFQSATFATGTLGALRFIVTGMSELPGRKSVILFSDGFRLLERDEQGFSGRGRVYDFLNQLIETANRASVVFYTIDARGLQTTGITAADSVNPTPERIQQILSERSDELFETQAGLNYLARQTGGFAIVNNNDLAGGVQRVLEDQSYYLLAYEPDSETFDPKTRRFNKLEIKVRTKGANVRYRSGFFNYADRETSAATTKNQTPQQQIENALVSPFAINDISLRLNSLFGNNAAMGSFVRPLLHINTKDLKFEAMPDGSRRSIFTVLAMLFGDNGTVIDQIGKSYTITVPADVFEQISRTGFVYHFSVPIKKPGAYQLRVAIRDSQAGKVGSASQFIEVPNLKKNRLTLSGIVLENLDDAQWKVFESGTTVAKAGEKLPERPNPMNDTSLRRFKKGTILRYGFEIYNSRLDAARQPNLTSQIRVFSDGKLVLDGKKLPVDVGGQTDLERIKVSGAVNLTNGMKPGDYILQIIVYDNLAKEKRKISTQYVQFEVTA